MMDISSSRLADNSVYYLYLADTGQHIKSGDRKTQEHSSGLIRFPLSPVLPQQLLKLPCSNEETRSLLSLSLSLIVKSVIFYHSVRPLSENLQRRIPAPVSVSMALRAEPGRCSANGT